jgi:hypothetical protein
LTADFSLSTNSLSTNSLGTGLAADMSAAPEIALLAAARSFPPAGNEPPGGPLTVGTLAGRLRTLSAAPERWWGLVRFDPARSVLIEVEDQPAYGAWLTIMPPGAAGRDCDCHVATLIAGEAAEGGTALRPGPVRVHGQRHWLRGHGTGYSISLHARTVPGGASGAEFSVAEFTASREFAIQRLASFG